MRPWLAVASTAVLLAACSTSTVAVQHASPSAVASPSSSKLTPVSIPPQETILSMRMTSLHVMWVATDTRVLRSTDAGGHWTDVTPGRAPARWSAFFALDDGDAWAASSQDRAPTFTVMRTTDGGRTWLTSTASMTGIAPTVVDFIDRLHGWLLVDGGVAAGSQAVAIDRTTDGGATWTLVADTGDPSTGQTSPSGLLFGCDKGAFAFGSRLVGLLPESCATNQQDVYRTADGGLHWQPVSLPQLGGLYGMFFAAPIFVTPTDAFMAANGQLVGTHDGGASWTVHKLPGAGTVDFESPLSGWQLNDHFVSTTSDGGRTWRTIASVPFDGSALTLQYLGKGIALAFWWHGTTAYRTDDSGRSWRPIAPAGLSS